MIEIVWEFVVKPEAIEAFVDAYGPDGDWSQLFGLHPGYRGTTLLRDTHDPRRFLTVDRWESLEAFARMRADSAALYAELDRDLAPLTESERELGVFTS